MSRWFAAILVALALACAGIGPVRAQDFSGCASSSGDTALCPSVAAALAGMQSAMEQQCQARTYRSCPTNIIEPATCTPVDRGTTSHDCWLSYNATETSGQTTNTRSIVRRVWKDSSCLSRADMINARFQGNAGSCSGGCQYAPVLGGGETYRTVTIKGVSFTSASRMAPTGQQCTVSAEEPQPTVGDEDQCFQDNTLTQCVKKDGSICTKSSTGKTFCWSPGENGIKTSGNEAASKVPEGKEARVPPVPPANGGDWEKIAEALVKISESKGGTTTTNNSTVNNFGSSYGSQGSGASGNGGAGQGNGGPGDGSGTGGKGDGEGGDGDSAGPPGAAAGDLYTANGKTVASVFSAFRARVGESPLIGAVKSFFTVHGGGACPTFTVPASQYWESMTYDAHCSGEFLSALRAIGWVLMAIAALAAAYWALS